MTYITCLPPYRHSNCLHCSNRYTTQFAMQGEALVEAVSGAVGSILALLATFPLKVCTHHAARLGAASN